MNDLFAYVPNFLLILLRASIFLALLPFFGSKNFPAQFRIGFVLAIALVLTPVVNFEVSKSQIPLIVMREILLGIALGLVARTSFFVVEMAGQLISNAMGLSLATIFNPEIGQSTEVARLYGILAMLIFLSMDAHHDLITVFVRSYEWLPAGHLSIRDLMPEIVSAGSRLFVIALKMGAPVVVVMLLTNLLLGFLYKAAPQMNVFFVGYPVYLFVGFLVMFLSMPVLTHVIGGHFTNLKDEMIRVITTARG